MKFTGNARCGSNVARAFGVKCKTGEILLVTRSTMKLAVPLLLTLTVAGAAPGSLLETKGPVLAGSVTRPECKEALVIAQAAFASDSPRLYAPFLLPSVLSSELVLGASELDLSGGDALQVDETMFEKHRTPDSTIARAVYWQRHGEHGHRLIVQETPRGWRGDAYSAFITPDEQTVGDFVARLGQPAQRGSNGEILSGVWRPPPGIQARRIRGTLAHRCGAAFCLSRSLVCVCARTRS